MAIPYRGQTGHATYFVTANAFQKKSLLQTERSASLLIEVMLHYRQKGNYLVHQFVVMPDHLHLLLTPTEVTLERSLQYIKGAFSYRAGKEFGWKREIWQTSFADRRVRDLSEYQGFTRYIHQNPVRRGLAPTPESFPYSSANGRFPLDPIPQRLKPSSV